MVPEAEILTLVRKCTWKLSQIGFYTRVKQVRDISNNLNVLNISDHLSFDHHQVDRVAVTDEDGNIHIEPRLVSYESPEIPEPFLVVRT